MSNPHPTTDSAPVRRDPLLRLLALLAAVFALICLSCCTGSWFVEQNSVDVEFDTPGDVREVSTSIAEFGIPAKMKPWKARRLEDLISARAAAVWRAEKGSLLLLGSVSRQFDPLTTDTAELIAQIPYSRLFDERSYIHAHPVVTQEIQIQGVKVSFEVQSFVSGVPMIVPGTSTGVQQQPLIQIQGSFPRPNGSTGLIILQVADGEVDHLKLLQSLADPGSVSPAEATKVPKSEESAVEPTDGSPAPAADDAPATPDVSQ